ncbi:hypothetical protein CCHR01_15253 [Colletotrichum chrysophilum]|uniref:Uncharacterized protein n=1 Tax=Colletotrichum chrysophilum TaxID=1836956 RepID=A0AAD9A5Y9_9PEZI|nr:hypothetical protein CCHR01_15253 [Colletotrichum chrysophilum]
MRCPRYAVIPAAGSSLVVPCRRHRRQTAHTTTSLPLRLLSFRPRHAQEPRDLLLNSGPPSFFKEPTTCVSRPAAAHLAGALHTFVALLLTGLNWNVNLDCISPGPDASNEPNPSFNNIDFYQHDDALDNVYDCVSFANYPHHPFDDAIATASKQQSPTPTD